MEQSGTRKRLALQPVSQNVPLAHGAPEQLGLKRRAAAELGKPTNEKRLTRHSSGIPAPAPRPAEPDAALTTRARSTAPPSSSIPGFQGASRPSTRSLSGAAAQQHVAQQRASDGRAESRTRQVAATRCAGAPQQAGPRRGHEQEEQQKQPVQEQQLALQQTPTSSSRLTRAAAVAMQRTSFGGSPVLAPTSSSPLHVPASYAKRRLSAARKPQQGMDKLQSEYAALQQKLSLLRDAKRGAAASQAALLAASMVPRPAETPTPAAAVAMAGPSEQPVVVAAATAADSGAGLQRPANPVAALAGLQFRERHEGSPLAAAATAVFEDPEWVRMCEEGMGAQLQRTREGATPKSRILQLAGMVKSLRRCLRETLGKVSQLVDQGVMLEHRAMEIRAIEIGSPTQQRLEADAALARKEAAQISATYRAERAQWMAEVNAGKFDVARLNRELEALEEQRARAREDAQRAEKGRIQLEADIKELRKSADQRLRESHMMQGEAARALAEECTAFEQREAQLKERVQGLQDHLETSRRQAAGLEKQMSAMQAAQHSLQSSLEGKQTAEAALAMQLAQAHAQVAGLRLQLASSQGSKVALQQELRAAQNQATLLESEVKLKGTRLEAAERALAAEREARSVEAAVLEEQLRAAQSGRAQAQADTLAAHADADESRRQAADAGAARARAEAAAQQLQQRHERLQADNAALKQQARMLSTALRKKRPNCMFQCDPLQSLAAPPNAIRSPTCQAASSEEEAAAAREAAIAANARASQAEASLAAAMHEAAAQAGRLAHLEGEFNALQELMGEGEQRDMVSRLLSRVGALEVAAASSEAARRALHNQVVELRGNIRVFCRVRPHPQSAVRCLATGDSLALAAEGKEHTFSFDRVFGPQASQAQIFGEVSELVQSALDGYHVCLFSYGQTGAGKTYTMQGEATLEGAGVIPRAVDLILARSKALEAQQWEYSVDASFIEVYNNTLRDLLADGAAHSPDAGRIADANAIKHDTAGGHTTVAGASRTPVGGASHAAELVRRAAEARACGETAMNSASSRSHVVFMLYIAGSHAATGTQLAGCLCLVDLAGSERLDRSLAEGQAKKEACSINQSLSALGDVFAALLSKSTHVPYRNSKLTYLLKPCLGGSGKTLMFVNINPEPASVGESLCSLKFAAKVNGCERGGGGAPRRNTTVAPGGASGSRSGGAGGGAGGSAAGMDVSAIGKASIGGKRAGPGAAGGRDNAKRSRHA